MLVVKPVFTLIALKHELVNEIRIMRIIAVAVTIEEVFTVIVLIIFIVLFVRIQLAGKRSSTVATVTSEVHS